MATKAELKALTKSQIADQTSAASVTRANIKARIDAAYDYTDRSQFYPEIPKTVLWDNQLYNAFPVSTTRNNVPYIFIKSANDHASQGPLEYVKFVNGAFTTPAQVSVEGVDIDCDALCIGAYDDRIYLAYQVGVPLISVLYAYNDDGGSDYVDAGSVAKRTGHDFVAATFKIIRMPSGKLFHIVYGADSTNAYLYLHQSTNNGVSWTDSGITVFSGLKSNTYPTPGDVTEASIEVVEEGTNDATTKLVVVARGENFTGLHYQFYSDDGGATWSAAGGSGFVTSEDIGAAAHFPMSLKRVGEDLYAISGSRVVDAMGLGARFNVNYLKAKALDVYNDTSAWGKKRTVSKSVSAYTYAGADFGYTEWFVYNDKIYVVYYDASTDADPTSDPVKHMRINVVPLEEPDFLEVIAKADQTGIVASTVTPIVFDTKMLDSNLLYDKNTNVFTIRRTGWYIFGLRVQCDSNTTGTYREARINVVHTPLVGNGNPTFDAYSHRFIEGRSIKAADCATARFGLIQFTTKPYYLEEGLNIIPEFIHDATSNRTIDNTTDLHTRAMFTAFKLDKN